MTRYAAVALFLAAFSEMVFPVSGRAEGQLSLHYGKHRYSPGVTHMLLGAEYNYRFTYNLSIGAGADYLSSDFGGTATHYFADRLSAGPNYQFVLGCLPINITPGVGLEYLRFRGKNIEAEEGIGYYVRAKFMLRIMSELGAGIVFRRSWNRLESLGQEAALELQINF